MGKSPIGLILVVGLVAVAGWCFMAGPCKGWLDNIGGKLGNSIGGVLDPLDNAFKNFTAPGQKLPLEAQLNADVADLTKKFGVVPTGASDGSIVSQQQMPFSAPPKSSFAHSYMGHLSYW